MKLRLHKVVLDLVLGLLVYILSDVTYYTNQTYEIIGLAFFIWIVLGTNGINVAISWVIAGRLLNATWKQHYY